MALSFGAEWESFVQREYGIPEKCHERNHFFLSSSPRVIQLHGYGDPLLDKTWPSTKPPERAVKYHLTLVVIQPNINVEKDHRDVQKTVSPNIKYSIESVEERSHKQIKARHPTSPKVIERSSNF